MNKEPNCIEIFPDPYSSFALFINYISSDIETLTLKDLQGMTGLKALRVSVLYNKSSAIKESKAVELLKDTRSSLTNV